MSIDELLNRKGFLSGRLYEIETYEESGKCSIIFKESYVWDGCDARISNLQVLYAPATREILAFQLSGTDLDSVIDYVDSSASMFWTDIALYEAKLNTAEPTVTLLTDSGAVAMHSWGI